MGSRTDKFLYEIVSQTVDEWIEDVEFESTRDVPIPENLVDQVIGQEAGSVVIRKAAEQRRHMLMIETPVQENQCSQDR